MRRAREMYKISSLCPMVSDQNGVSVLYIMLEIHHSGREPSICPMFGIVTRDSESTTCVCSEIFPYLVMIIGLENVLVITKSVVSTPVHLDVKIRVAQGLI